MIFLVLTKQCLGQAVIEDDSPLLQLYLKTGLSNHIRSGIGREEEHSGSPFASDVVGAPAEAGHAFKVRDIWSEKK